MKALIQNIWNWKHLVSLVGGIFFLLGVVFFFFQNSVVLSALAPESVSIGVTILVVDRIVERQQRNERKRELLQNMGSKSNDFSVTAARTLRLEGWLFDGSLEGRDFGWAELHKADLSRAEMTGADFTNADLSKTNLACAILKGATLTGVDLEGANLALANLDGASVSAEQLKAALRSHLIGSIMPDGTKLRDSGEHLIGVDCERVPNPNGPTFEEWLLTQEDEEE